MIEEMFSKTVAAYSGRIAVVFGRQVVTYAELQHQVAALRGGLRRLDIGTSDCVLVVLPNCPAFIVTYLATAGLRATVQAVDPALTAAELAEILRQCEPAAIVTTSDRVRVLEQAGTTARQEPAVIVVDSNASSAGLISFAELLSGSEDSSIAAPFAGDWVFAFSSGSTGEPRRVCRSQANQVAEAENIVSTAAIAADDVILCPVPLFHALGQFCCLIVALRSGATLVLVDTNAQVSDATTGEYPWYMGRIIDLIREHRVTIFPAVPYIFEALAGFPRQVPGDFSTVRLCLSGSNFLSDQVRERFEARFGVPVRQTYGSSEAGSVCWDCEPGIVNPGSVGRPLNGVSVAVMDPDGHMLPAGVVGEIAVASAAVMSSYADDGESAVFQDGRYLTGDLGMLDDQGRIYVTGRKRILIDTGGHKVNPVEIEGVLKQHPAVAEAAVVGLPVRGSGHLLAAAVVTRTPVDDRQLRDYCRCRLADYKIPDRFVMVAEIPRTALGKVSRARLSAQLAAAPAWPAQARIPADLWSRPGAERARLISDVLRHRVAALAALPAQAVNPDSRLRDLGIDSLGAVRLKMAIQDDFGRVVELASLLGSVTVAALATELSVPGGLGEIEALIAGQRAVGEFPLSPGQLSIWHADQLAPESAAYNRSFAARLTSRCDPEALRRSFQALIDRHGVLRTTFPVRDGMPLQHVLAQGLVDFKVTEVPAGGDAVELLNEEASRPFRLDADQPMRVRLYYGAGADPLLLVTVHHIVTDFWSMILMLREIGTTYAGFAAGQEVYQPGPSYTYLDYGRWLAGQVDGPAGDRDWQYWQAQLDPVPPVLELPVDRPRPVVQAQLGATYFQSLQPQTVTMLRKYARAHATTIYAVLLAGFYVLLHACTGEQDIAVAVITTNRQRSEFSDILGYFANPVVVRIRVDARQSFSALVDRVQAGLLPALSHQTLPFEAIVERLGIMRTRSRSPLVEVAFGQNKAQDAEMAAVTGFLSGNEGARLALGPLALESIALEQRGIVYDFSGAVYEAGDSISLAWEYNRELFELGTILGMAGRFERILGQVLDRPELLVGKANLLGEPERLSLIAGSAAKVPARTGCLSVLAAQWSAARTDGIALVTEGAELTYRQLDERSGALATLLERLAMAPPRTRVLLWLASPLHQAVAGLAVLRAGGVCEVLPASAGPAEVSEMSVRGDAAALVTTSARQAVLTADAAAVVLPIAEDDKAPLADMTHSVHGSRRERAAADPAVLLRTSGVAERPRAFLVGEDALMHFANWLRLTFPPSSNVLVSGGLEPDAALVRILAVVAAGGTVHAVPGAASPADLAMLLSGGHEIGVAFVTPAELALISTELIRMGTRPQVGSLCVTGEPLFGYLVRRWRALAGNQARVVHAYTSAACGLVISAGDVPAEVADDAIVPAGKAAPGAERYVLDDSGRICPVGVTGEICVAEAMAARPAEGDRDASRLILHPLSEDGERMLWRTGDVGYYLADGSLAVLGDRSRLKLVRGYQVETGRVEAALARLGRVTGVVVEGGGEVALTARVSACDSNCGPRPTGPMLRDELRRTLPEYMVPASVSVVDVLPFAGNGKLKRHQAAQVPVAAWSVAVPRDQVRGRPLNRAAVTLAAIWRDVLGAAEVGPDDDYFELGGDSILSMRIVSRAADAGIEITPRQLFTYPTLAELAAVAKDKTGGQRAAGDSMAAHGDEAVAGLPEREHDRLVPLTPVQRWFFDLCLSQPGHWNQQVLLAVDPVVSTDILRSALEFVAGNHPAFRLRFSNTGHGWEQREDSASQAIRISELRAPATTAALARSAGVDFDLDRSPLFAAAIAPAADCEGLVLFLVAHHLVVDLVSWQVIIDGLGLACRALLRGERPRPPGQGLSFAGWARALQLRAAEPDVLAEFRHWAELGGPSVPVLGAIAAPQPDFSSVQQDAREVTASLPCDLAAGAVSRSARPQEIVLAATADALASWAGQDYVRIDVETHGRRGLPSEQDLSRTVGWFTSFYPFRYMHQPARIPADVLRHVTRAVRYLRHDGLSYGLLRYASPDPQVRARLAALPPPLASFNYLGGGSRLLSGREAAMDSEGLLRLMPLTGIPDRGPGNARPYPLEVSALVTAGQLTLKLAFSEREHSRGEIEDLAGRILGGIREMLAEPAVRTGQHVASGDLKQLVREAWIAALGHADFDGDEDFFAVIGGHSLLVAQIMARLGKAFGRRLSLRLFFDNPTVNLLAAALSGTQGNPRASEEVNTS